MPDKKNNFWLILIVACAAVFNFVGFLLLHNATPSDGTRIATGGLTDQGLVLDVFPSSAGSLQDGDILTAIEGIPIADWTKGVFNAPPAPTGWSIGDQLTYSIARGNRNLDVEIILVEYPFWNAFLINWGTVVYAIIFWSVAAFVIIRRPQNTAGRIMFLAASLVTGSTVWSFGLNVFDLVYGTGYWLHFIGSFICYQLYWISLVHFSLSFPQQAPILRRRWFIPLIYTAPILVLLVLRSFTFLQAENIFDWLINGSIGEGFFASLFLLGSIIALVWQIRSRNSTKIRQQIQWMLLASLFTGLAGFFLYILPGALGLPQISPNVLGLLIIPFPLVLAIAILRHNLFDIDTLINRALVYGSLTLGTVLLYVFIVGTVADLLNIQDRTMVAFLGTGLVAILFQPLRERLQRWVNRLMYGDRDDPYSVLTQLGRTLDSTFGPETVLPSILETVANALKLPYSALYLENDKPLFFGTLPEGIETERFPLRFKGQAFGELVVAPRAADEPFSTSERNLLEDLCRQIETAVRNVRLANDLQRSRRRLVTAREEERRRIRRDLHDGLGPLLASQAMTLEAIEELVKPGQDTVLELLLDLKLQSREAITDIRRLVYELRPPELDNLGLVDALRQSMSVASQNKVYFQFKIPEPLPTLPAAVELAAYRIAQEAMTNVIKHSYAKNCTIQLACDDQYFFLDISDDGIGLPSEMISGVGMISMRERAEELGGSLEIVSVLESGISVVAKIPLL